jgi:hypothetical protein
VAAGRREGDQIRMEIEGIETLNCSIGDEETPAAGA